MNFTHEELEDLLRQATRQDTVGGAVSWIAEGYPLEINTGTEKRRLLRALVAYGGGSEGRTARERVVRELARSDLDTAAVVFGLDEVRTPEQFRRALDALAWKNPSNTLVGLTAASVLNAQRAEPTVMLALCSIAGISMSKLGDWTGADLPSNPTERWTLKQVEAALAVIDRIVEGRDETTLESAKPLRALELMFAGDGPKGWALVEQMRRGGVPYEVLLAQRTAGGGWLAHRNRTSGQVSTVLANELCELLDEREIDYLRSKRAGGFMAARKVERVSGASGSVGLVVCNHRRQPVASVALSVARDGGTARASGSRLLKLRNSKLPILLLLAGPGWADRNETADLAEAFAGEVYTDQHLNQLADELARRAQAHGS